jgi:hypothetical protein
MTGLRRISHQEKKFFALLQRKERTGQTVTLDEIEAETTWKRKGTISKYLTAGMWDPYLESVGQGVYRVHGTKALSLEQFAATLSQVQRPEVVALAKAHPEALVMAQLRAEARSEFILAVETYNRPSVEARIGAFCRSICTAWEKLLKARIIELYGRGSLKGDKPGTTIGLAKCVKKVLDANRPIAQNIFWMSKLRNDSTHFLTPEVLPVYGRIFQACVFNFMHLYKEHVGIPVIEDQGLSFMAFYIPEEHFTEKQMVAKYGTKRWSELKRHYDAAVKEIDKYADQRFAVPMKFTLAYVDKREEPAMSLEKIQQPTQMSVIVERPVDARATHPLRATEVQEAVNERLKAYPQLLEHLARIHPGTGPRFNQDDFNSIVRKEGWQAGNNRYHYDHGALTQHTYSKKTVDHIVRRLVDGPEYLEEAKEAYKQTNRRRRK